MKKKTDVAVILTCHNRKEKTVNCIKKLVSGNPEIVFRFIIVDDGSTDGTGQELERLEEWVIQRKGTMSILHGDGNLYWGGGMRKGMVFAKKEENANYCLLVNDDVDFFEHSIEKMVKMCCNDIIVGATCDSEDKLTYSGIRYVGKGVAYKKIEIDDVNRICDTFNANCVLIPFAVFAAQPVIDDHFVHFLGDLDYGLEMKRCGLKIETTDFYVGRCNIDFVKENWNNTALSRIDRIRKKESVKGLPFKQWFYFLKKNFGIRQAIFYSCTPYIRILVGR